MENLETIEKLLKNSSEIVNLFNVKIPKWDADRKHYDKVRVGFSEGSSDGWCTPVTLHFLAWCGTYGDSSTYKQINTDHEIFNKFFIKYLNNHKKDIMMGVADLIYKEASTLKEKAQKELESKLELVKSL